MVAMAILVASPLFLIVLGLHANIPSSKISTDPSILPPYEPIHSRGVYRDRPIQWLDGRDWDFKTEHGSWNFLTEASNFHAVPVPGTWNVIPGMENFLGTGIYRKTFNLSNDLVSTLNSTRVVLRFRGANYRTSVSLNGHHLGTHEGGYTPFSFDVTDTLLIDDNVLEVTVNNEHLAGRVPGRTIGWFPHGGIYREVYLEAANLTCFDDNPALTATPVIESIPVTDPTAACNATLKVNVTLINRVTTGLAAGAANVSVRLRVGNDTTSTDGNGSANGTIVGETLQNFTLPAGTEPSPTTTSIAFCLNLTNGDMVPWYPLAPCQYSVELDLINRTDGAVLDRYVQNIGFRNITIANVSGVTHYTINGYPFQFRGINRHEDFGDENGRVATITLMQRDLDLLKDMGVNCIRTFHYANHPAWLEMVEEAGIGVIEEPPSWNLIRDDFASASVRNLTATQAREMVLRDRNRACVLMFGAGNEGETEAPEFGGFLDAVVGAIRAADLPGAVRPTYYASFSIKGDETEEILSKVDVNAYNLKFGWYYGEVNQLEAWLEDWHANHPGRLLVCTEFAADARLDDFGYHKWSQPYQARLIMDTWAHFNATFNGTAAGGGGPGSANGSTIGGFVSCFADYRCPDRIFSQDPFHNMKGMMDKNRNPKLGYNATKHIYRNITFVPENYIDSAIDRWYPPIEIPTILLFLTAVVPLVLVLVREGRIPLPRRHEREPNTTSFNADSSPDSSPANEKQPSQTSIILFICVLIGPLSLAAILGGTIGAFLGTTTLPFPFFTIGERGVFLACVDAYAFPFFILLAFILFAVRVLLITPLCRTPRITSALEVTARVHAPFILTLPVALLSILNPLIMLVVIAVAWGLGLWLAGRHIRKMGKLGENEIGFFRFLGILLLPLLVVPLVLFLYLQLRMDIIGLLGLLGGLGGGV